MTEQPRDDSEPSALEKTQRLDPTLLQAIQSPEPPASERTQERPVELLPERTVALPVQPMEPSSERPAEADRTLAVPMVEGASETLRRPKPARPRRLLLWIGLPALALVLITGLVLGLLWLFAPETLGLSPKVPEAAPEPEVRSEAPAEPAPAPPALRPYLERAERGDAKAMYLLAVFYTQGVNVPQDMAEGRRWLRRAAEAGHAGAQKELRALEATK